MKIINRKTFTDEMENHLCNNNVLKGTIETYKLIIKNSSKIKVITINDNEKTRKVAVVMMGMHSYSIDDTLFAEVVENHLYAIPDGQFNNDTMILEFVIPDEKTNKNVKVNNTELKEFMSEFQRWQTA